MRIRIGMAAGVLALVSVAGLPACSKDAPAPTADAPKADTAATTATTAAAADSAAAATSAEAAAPEGSAAPSAHAEGAAHRVDAGASASSSASATAMASAEARAVESAPAVDGDKKTGAQYAAFLSGPKKVKAGSTVALSAVFTAQGNYHCNEKFPTSFKPDAAPEGVSFASDKFSGASFSTKRSSVPVTLTASSKGAKSVSGTLKFGVCDESECIPVKAQVAFAFDVE